MKTGSLTDRKEGDGFAYVAFWQFMTFLALLLVIWVNELWDLSHIYYETAPRPPNYFAASILSSGVILIALITVGHTYVTQKRIIKGLLTVCSYCHKIRLDQEMWEQMDEYLVDHSLASLSHGVCPECFERVTADIEHTRAGQHAHNHDHDRSHDHTPDHAPAAAKPKEG